MVLPAAAAMPVPAGWTDEQALGLVVNWPTALAALKPLGGVTAGQTVLIHAAAGATGQAAVTMAKHYGATVIATASPGKHETGAGARRRPRPGLPRRRHRRRGAAADRRRGRRPGAGVGRRRHLRRQPGRGQAGHRPGRRLRPGRRRSRDHQLGTGVQAPGPRHRPEHRRPDPGRTADLRRGHGRAVRRSSPPACSPPAGPPCTTWPTARRRSRNWKREATVGKLALLP